MIQHVFLLLHVMMLFYEAILGEQRLLALNKLLIRLSQAVISETYACVHLILR